MDGAQEIPDGGGACITLDAKLDTSASEALVEKLHAFRGQDLTLDASQIDHLGAHAAQTILIAAKTWAADGHSFAVTALSETAGMHLQILGIPADALAIGAAP